MKNIKELRINMIKRNAEKIGEFEKDLDILEHKHTQKHISDKTYKERLNDLRNELLEFERVNKFNPNQWIRIIILKNLLKGGTDGKNKN